jgi:predicted amidohydrolase
MQDLTVTLIQADLRWHDPQANLQHLTHLIERDDVPTDLIVLPEMFTTGFSMDTSYAETMHGPAMMWMAETAARMDAVVTGSLMMAEGDRFYNRLIWMRPNGTFEQYDKRHLFGLGGEQQHYTPGNQRLVVEVKGWRVCTQICYDLRFPVWNRNTGDYDVLLYVANWPDRRRLAWQQLTIARAIENQAYVVAANRVGEDGEGVYCAGDSRVVDPLGQILFDKADVEAVASITLSLTALEETRMKLPFLKDADKFSIDM